MCGVSGIIMKNGAPVDHTRLKTMNDAAQHRGPDDEGFYFYGNIGLGHRRLSILDLSALGTQPMHYSSRYTITYNGEVYNYIEIREILKRKGYTFRSETDTEVILAAYQEWGEGCVSRFNGMWAFAIHDSNKNTLFISRDRFGVKPLHYFENETNFLFSSEIRQILTLVPERSVNKEMLFDYLYLGYHHHTNKTFFDGIHSLDPGHNLTYDLKTGSYVVSKWYELKVNNDYKSLSFEEAQELFESTLDNAIRLRLRSDVRVGTCLSGGLDSSYIATVAANIYNSTASEKFRAITAKSIEKENDETSFAEMVVKRADLDWKITTPGKEDFVKVMNEVIQAQEEPFGGPSIMMQYFVMQKAKEEGCTVLLDGQGGDEALLGYDRYFAAFVNQQKGIVGKIRSYLDITKNSKLNLTELFMYGLYFNSASIRAAWQLRRNHYIKSKFRPYLNRRLLREISDAGRDMTDLQHLEITRIQLQKLLKYEDRNSMKFSIETRVPFVDYNVIELAFSLPFSYKVHEGWSKYILRKSAEKKVPKEVVWRSTKIGFEAPKNWMLSKELLFKVIRESPFLEEFVVKEKISKKLDDVSLWKLYNLAVWAREFKVKVI